MARTRDPYDVLGVARDAAQEDLRKAYLKLAHKYHPDKTGGDKQAEEKLKKVNAAYDILKNPEKRSKFDQFGSVDGMGAGGFSSGFSGAGFEAPFDDFFDMLFGHGGRRRQESVQRGSDLELGLKVTLKDAACGVKRELRFSRMDTCGNCTGTGAESGSRPESCRQCGGSGQVRVAHGFFSVTRTCPQCRGAGKVIANPCRKCSGQGLVKKNHELSVDVPAGVETGSRLRVAGEGEPGANNGPRGDLFIHIEVAPHDLFHRDGTTLVCELPITLAEAALGTTVRVPTLKGGADLKIPAGTQTGAQFRLRGLGMPDLRGYREGDLIAKIVIETPARLSRRQKELLREAEELNEARTYPRQRRFKEAMKREDQ